MTIKILIDVRVTFYHKQTMQKLIIDKSTKMEYNENSDEYLGLCSQYENEIGFTREEDKTKFDEVLSDIIMKESEKSWNERLTRITEVMRTCYIDDTKNGYVELAGYILNARDFCAMGIDRFKIRAIKE